MGDTFCQTTRQEDLKLPPWSESPPSFHRGDLCYRISSQPKRERSANSYLLLAHEERLQCSKGILLKMKGKSWGKEKKTQEVWTVQLPVTACLVSLPSLLLPWALTWPPWAPGPTESPVSPLCLLSNSPPSLQNVLLEPSSSLSLVAPHPCPTSVHFCGLRQQAEASSFPGGPAGGANLESCPEKEGTPMEGWRDRRQWAAFECHVVLAVWQVQPDVVPPSAAKIGFILDF